MDFQTRLSSCFERCFSCCQESNTSREKKPSGTVITNPHVEGIPAPNDERKVSVTSTAGFREIYVARYNYSARTDQDLSFNAGDTLEVLVKQSDQWWLARGLTGVSANRQGYIPANFVAPVESLDAQPWYFSDIRRMEAEKLLLTEGNQHGSFLVRKSETQEGEFSLSVLDNWRVKHYKIKQMQNGEYFLSTTRSFSTLKELVEHYSATNGLCVRLAEPCKKIVPQTISMSYNTVDHWEIDRKSIKLLKKLGAGQFGEVYEGLWNDTTAVAVKTLKPGTMDPEDFLREAQIMKTLHHTRLIQLYAVCTLEEPIFIITELMKSSLLEHLQEDKGETLQTSDQIEMAAQVASGMAFLELKNYIHRDLAARNVLVGENNICKVADFGLARVFMKANENVYNAKVGTKIPVKWTAPEAMHYNKFSIKSDVWSFGILLYEIMTFGQMPYPAMTGNEAVQQISKGYRMPCPPNCQKTLHDIMMECWREKEQQRPSFKMLQERLEELNAMDETFDESAYVN